MSAADLTPSPAADPSRPVIMAHFLARTRFWVLLGALPF